MIQFRDNNELSLARRMFWQGHWAPEKFPDPMPTILSQDEKEEIALISHRNQRDLEIIKRWAEIGRIIEQVSPGLTLWRLKPEIKQIWKDDPRIAHDLTGELAKLDAIPEANHRERIPFKSLICTLPRNPNNPQSSPCNTKPEKSRVSSSLIQGVLGPKIAIGWVCKKCRRTHHFTVDLEMVRRILLTPQNELGKDLEKAQRFIGQVLRRES